MVCWSYKKLCFVILLPYNVVLCCHVDISRGCLQVSIAPCLTVHTDRSVLNDNYTITKGGYVCSITAARKLQNSSSFTLMETLKKLSAIFFVH